MSKLFVASAAKKLSIGMCAVSALILGGCGGGASSTPAATLTGTSITISGTAATGAAMANATVNAKCAVGSGNATTGSDGKYSVTMNAASLPCALNASDKAGNTFHSLVAGTGNSGSLTANLSPLTELVVAKVASDTPANLFANFDAAAQATLTNAAVNSAIASLAITLKGTVDLTDVDPIKDTLIVGNSLDQKIDALQAALFAAQTSLGNLASAIVASGDTPASVQTILKSAATSCPGLRSGTYVAISPVDNSSVAPAARMVNVDAPTLKLTFTAGTVTKSYTMKDDGGCAYSLPDDGDSSSKILVSKSGLAVMRDTGSTGTTRAGKTWVSNIFIPAQEIPLTNLAGQWNFVEHFRDPVNVVPGFVPSYGPMTVDATGAITAAGTSCDYMSACPPSGLVTRITACPPSSPCLPSGLVGRVFGVDQSGGFDIGGSGPTEPASRAFAFKTADGHLSMFLLYSTGRGMVVLSKQESLALPAVGTVSNIWEFVSNSAGTATALSEQSITVTAVDAVAGSFTRTRASDNRLDSFKINEPQIGLRSRAVNSCTSTINGQAIACDGTIIMNLPGTGVGFYLGTSLVNNYFGIFVDKP